MAGQYGNTNNRSGQTVKPGALALLAANWPHWCSWLWVTQRQVGASSPAIFPLLYHSEEETECLLFKQGGKCAAWAPGAAGVSNKLAPGCLSC